MSGHKSIRDFIKVARQATYLTSINIPHNPVPAARPRVSKWGTYYPKTYANWRKLAEASVLPGQLCLAKDAPILVLVESVGKRPATSKRRWPIGDTDNHAKAVLDVITKAEDYWYDDDQAVWLISGKRYVRRRGEEPHSEAHLYLCEGFEG